MRVSHAKKTTSDTSPKSVSRGTFLATIALVAVIAFCLGTRGNELLAVVGPVFGIKVPHGTIDLASVEKTYRELNANYDGKLDRDALITGANEGMVDAVGDKFTTYLDSKEAKAFSDDLKGNVGSGIGVEIAVRNSVPTITQVLPDNPAARAGLKADDQIIAVDGATTEGMNVSAVASKVRGKTGSTVKLTINRNGEQREYTLTRQSINNPSVTGKVENGIGIMRISRFDDKTGDLARQTAQDFKNQRVRGVVLDLRDNGGGYVDAARTVAGLWLSGKTVVIEKTNGKVINTVTSDSNPILDGTPTVVLVNHNTASASEIVAGALQDYGVAKLVGTKTYGKGTMQEVIKLGDGNELKVTVAHWYTPHDHSINQKGLTPNQAIDLTEADRNSGNDPQLQTALDDLGK